MKHDFESIPTGREFFTTCLQNLKKENQFGAVCTKTGKMVSYLGLRALFLRGKEVRLWCHSGTSRARGRLVSRLL